MLLDQIVLQDQRFQLGIRDNILKAVDLFDHLVDLRTSPYDFTKIRADAIVEVHGLAHVDNRIPLIMHNVYARLGRQFLQFFFYIEHPSRSLTPKMHYRKSLFRE